MSAVGEWESMARVAASQGGADEEQELLREFLAFELDATPYAIPIERVREIVRMREITPVPRVPEEVLGVVALRGEVVEVVDLRMCLGAELRAPSRRTRIIVLHGDENRVTGVLVDSVREVMRVPDRDITLATSEAGVVSDLFRRDEEFVSILDIERVLDLA